MNLLICIALGYVLGMVNPSYIISRMKGFDIRDRGSGNAGASNALVMLGRGWGVFCGAFDILKAFLAFQLAQFLFPDLASSGVAGGVGCIFGHLFPAVMGFRGGKGLACIAGVAIGFNWKLFLIFLAGAVVVVLVTGYITMVTLYAYVVFPVVYWFQTGDFPGLLILLLLSCIVFYKHRGNIQRILKGHEIRINILWNRNRELERLKDVFPDDYENAAK